jgi:nucleotide-binding universal stress UspA family protein
VGSPIGHRAGQVSRLRLPRRAGRAGGPDDLPREDVASRVSAYVYGNVLVMAALIALHPDELRGPTGVLYLLGVGVSTFVAHTVGEAVGLRVREGRSLDTTAVRREIRNALPIVTTAGAPIAVLLLAWTDLVDADVVLVLALGLVDVRLALLGSVVAWVSGERSSTRVFLAGFVLAVVAAATAVLKWQLTH